MTIDFFDKFKRTEKQIEAWKMISTYSNVLLYGGTRSGKSFLLCVAIIYRAMAAPGSDHLILRKTYKDARRTIFQKTLKDALELVIPDKSYYTSNKTDSIIELENGSKIICDGLDEIRIDSILGNEYATIFFNEVSELVYAVIETVLTRLAQVVKTVKGQLLSKKCFMDCNPPKKSHWSHKLFFEKINPEDKQPLKYPDDYSAMQINPIHNVEHLGQEYIDKTLTQLSKAKRVRFLHGEYGDDTEGALFKQSWIDQNRAKWDKDNNRWVTPDFERVIIAIDPAVTANKNSDETGIVAIATGRINEEIHYYVLSDRSDIYPVRKWAEVALEEYDLRAADKIIGEVNNGGDLVESNIEAVRPNFKGFTSVRATRGKAVRAEPVSTLYDKGYVHHVGVFDLLEDELTTWTPSDTESPNRLDALVWGVTELMGNSIKYSDPLSFTF